MIQSAVRTVALRRAARLRRQRSMTPRTYGRATSSSCMIRKTGELRPSPVFFHCHRSLSLAGAFDEGAENSVQVSLHEFRCCCAVAVSDCLVDVLMFGGRLRRPVGTDEQFLEA